MKSIHLNGATIVLSHVVSFALSDEEEARGTRSLALKIRLSNGDEIIVSGDELAHVHAQLRRAFPSRSSPRRR